MASCDCRGQVVSVIALNDLFTSLLQLAQSSHFWTLSPPPLPRQQQKTKTTTTTSTTTTENNYYCTRRRWPAQVKLDLLSNASLSGDHCPYSFPNNSQKTWTIQRGSLSGQHCICICIHMSKVTCFMCISRWRFKVKVSLSRWAFDNFLKVWSYRARRIFTGIPGFNRRFLEIRLLTTNSRVPVNPGS